MQFARKDSFPDAVCVPDFVGECNSPVQIRFLMLFLFLIIVSVIIYTSFEMPAGAEHLEQPTEHLEQPTIKAEKSDTVQWLPDLKGLVRSDPP